MRTPKEEVAYHAKLDKKMAGLKKTLATLQGLPHVKNAERNDRTGGRPQYSVELKKGYTANWGRMNLTFMAADTVTQCIRFAIQAEPARPYFED